MKNKKISKSFEIDNNFTAHELGIVIKSIFSSESVDSHNDIILASAIEDAIPDYLTNSPIIKEMHRSDSLSGKALDVKVIDKKSYLEALLIDVSTINKFKAGLLKELSLAGYVVDYFYKSDGVRVITKLILEEISLVVKGSNPDTEVLSPAFSFGKSFNEENVTDIEPRQITEEEFLKITKCAVQEPAQDVKTDDDVSDYQIDEKSVVAKLESDNEELQKSLDEAKAEIEELKKSQEQVISPEEIKKLQDELRVAKLSHKYLSKDFADKEVKLKEALEKITQLETEAVDLKLAKAKLDELEKTPVSQLQKKNEVKEIESIDDLPEDVQKSLVKVNGKVDMSASFGKLMLSNFK